MEPPVREALTWESFGPAIRDLARTVAESGYRPDLLLSITRGGLVPAGAMSYALGIKNLHIMNVEFYTGVDERLPMPVLLPPLPAGIALSGQRVLIVDDIADTGETLRSVHDFCAEHVAESRTAVLYEKPRSVVKCDYVWRHTSDWVAFPWSSEPPLIGPATDN